MMIYGTQYIQNVISICSQHNEQQGKSELFFQSDIWCVIFTVSLHHSSTCAFAMLGSADLGSFIGLLCIGRQQEFWTKDKTREEVRTTDYCGLGTALLITSLKDVRSGWVGNPSGVIILGRSRQYKGL